MHKYDVQKVWCTNDANFLPVVDILYVADLIAKMSVICATPKCSLTKNNNNQFVSYCMGDQKIDYLEPLSASEGTLSRWSCIRSR
jgi:hypothetical protein